jgi:hypothetical protein
MAVTATFKADFSSFTAAVDKAEIKLKDLESDARKVESALAKVAVSFSGQKIIQDAQLATKAIGDIANVTKLTENEQKRLNATVQEALAKYKALGQEAPKDMQALGDELKRIGDEASNMAPKAEAAGLSFKSLFGAFTLANLAGNAISSMTAAVGELASKGTKLPAIESAFHRLSTQVGVSSDDMLSNLQRATRGMVSEFDLMQSSNKALLLGLPVTAESMGDMASAATALGRAMGMDATKSFDDLITALGRSSPMILDNLGLTVKVSEANEHYAAKLGKTAEQLTEAEKKTAFYEEAMEKARAKTKELGEQTKTFTEQLATAWTTISNVITKAAAVANTEAGKLIETMGKGGADPSGRGSGTPDVLREAQAKVLQDSMDAIARAGGKVAASWGQANTALGITIQSLEELEAEEKEITQSIQRGDEARKASADAEKARIASLRSFYEWVKKNGDVLDDVNLKMHVLVNERLAALGSRGVNILKLTTDEAVRFGLAVSQGMAAGIPTITGLGKEFEKVGATGIAPLVPKLNTVKIGIGDLSKALAELATVAGGSFGQMASGFATLINAANTAKQSITAIKDGAKAAGSMDGLLQMSTGIMGIVTAAATAVNAIKALWSAFDRNKGRDAVEEFAKSFGGFDQLHAELLKMGDAGEALWVKLTQGVGRNNPEQAARVIAEIEEALRKQAEASDDATGASEEQAQATIETATQAAKALEELGPKIKANEDEWKSWGSIVTAQIQAIADGIRALPPLPVPALGGGSGSGSSGPTGGAPGTFIVSSTVNIDGRVAGEAVARQIVG